MPEIPETEKENPFAREGTWRAVTQQCLNQRIPGYTGYLPSKRSENIFGAKQALLGEFAVKDQSRTRKLQEERRHPSHSVEPAPAPLQEKQEQVWTQPKFGALRKNLEFSRSQCTMIRNHWCPTIPGYAGYIPAKVAENIVGGGTTETCRLARRAIVERPPPKTPPKIDGRGSIPRSQSTGALPKDDRERLAEHMTSHCHGKIPGYMGFIPRVAGDSIYGATFANQNRIAAKQCQDRVANPPELYLDSLCKRWHSEDCTNPPKYFTQPLQSKTISMG